MTARRSQVDLYDTTGQLDGRVLDGRYRVLRLVSERLTGRDYLADDRESNQRVVLRLLPPFLKDDDALIHEIESATAAMASLNHPNVARPQRVFRTDEGVVVAMEATPTAAPLSELLADGPVEHDRVHRLFSAVSDAMDMAHALGVIHGDLRPESILIDDASTPYLNDFVISRAVLLRIAENHPEAVADAVAYMPPEQLEGDPPTREQDIYSLAATMYAALAGRPPFEGDAMDSMILEHEPDPPLAQATPMSEAILAGLAKSPADRPRQCRRLLGRPGGKARSGGGVRARSTSEATAPAAADQAPPVSSPTSPEAVDDPFDSILGDAASSARRMDEAARRMFEQEQSRHRAQLLKWSISGAAVTTLLLGILIAWLVLSGDRDETGGTASVAGDPAVSPSRPMREAPTSPDNGEAQSPPASPSDPAPPDAQAEGDSLARSPVDPDASDFPSRRPTDRSAVEPDPSPDPTGSAASPPTRPTPDARAPRPRVNPFLSDPILAPVAPAPRPDSTRDANGRGLDAWLSRPFAVLSSDLRFASPLTEIGADLLPEGLAEMPDELRTLVFTPPIFREGLREFRPLTDGVVILAVYRKDWGDPADPTGGWRNQLVSRFDLESAGWQVIAEPGDEWMLFARMCQRHERFAIRTKRFITPILFTQPETVAPSQRVDLGEAGP